MELQHSTLLLVIALTAIGIVSQSVPYPRTMREYWQRPCMGRAWKETFPRASKEKIRELLYMFVDAFAFSRSKALQFAPTDRVLAIYRGLYPVKGWPDALELETLARRLETHYGLDLKTIWRDDLTLGEMFSRINLRIDHESLKSSQV